VIVLVLVLGWLTLGLLAVRSSVSQANERLDPRARAVLAPSGALLTDPTTLLLIGVDDQANSDTLQLLRFDPNRQLQATLAIPRDLRVNVPGYGDEKINAAYAAGGSALAIRTVAEYTGLPVEHVMVIDFDGLEQVVDAVGGIEVDNPGNIRSVFGAELYTFPKGPLKLNGEEALAYARVRKNILNPSDSDVSRGQRQQAVISALRAKAASPSGLLRLRNVATSLGGAFATDLTLWQFLQLGYLDARASTKLRCNLGGTPAPLDGQDVLIPDGAGNRRVLGEFLGNAAVQPAASRSVFAAQCRTP
jgi:LCP family protein required for cell wall assembly